MEWIVQNWQFVLVVILAAAFVLILGGYYRKLKKEVGELIAVFREAIEDGNVDDAEVARILKEGKDVEITIKEFIRAITQIIPKR